ncbi:MAG TPA: hypothetical protein VNW24_14475, partial [Stellaceae bacterium]|nr:hypothetical protein [Stellaceae bacterium]
RARDGLAPRREGPDPPFHRARRTPAGMQHEIWLNDRDVPVNFRIVDGGTAVDFILASPLQDATVAEANLVPTANVRSD